MRIPLTGKNGAGKFALIDRDDLHLVEGIKWHLSDTGYALNRSSRNTLRMHRVINDTPDGLFTDHINGNKLDNRRANLRTVTNKENLQNLHKAKWYSHYHGKYEVRYKGRFYVNCKTKKDALRAVKEAVAGLPRPSERSI